MYKTVLRSKYTISAINTFDVLTKKNGGLVAMMMSETRVFWRHTLVLHTTHVKYA